MNQTADQNQISSKAVWLRRLAAACFGLLWAVLSINVPFPQFYVIQHVPTVVALVLVYVWQRNGEVSEADFYAVLFFLVLHLIGARYIYSLVPYDEWCELCFGFTLSETFGWQRNHYDRLVHFLYGVLISIPTWNLFRRKLTVSRVGLLLLVLQFILATSAIYEVAEWVLTIVLAPQWAESYNGQQGDMWDAQKDIALALAGSCVICLVLMGRTPVTNKKHSEQTR